MKGREGTDKKSGGTSFYKKVLEHSAFIGIGRRKTSVARVFLVAGNGRVFINGRVAEEYFQFNPSYLTTLKLPLTLVGVENMYNVFVKTHGGGLRGQSDAIQLAVARALVSMSPENKVIFKSKGVLRCDARCKERKKYGLKKARKAPQFSKR